jgi:alpha-tubulin suppressor-like RCC1 family protein
VRCWGTNVFGNLGDGSMSEEGSGTPVRVDGVTDARSLAVGRTHACVVVGEGEVRCWGSNQDLQLGLVGSSYYEPRPVPVPGLPAARSVHAGGYHTCAVLEGGTAWCWGRDDQGQLGGRDVSGRGPARVRSLTGVANLALGIDHSCALLTSRSVQCWGDNINGQLGTMGGPDARTPVPVALLSEVSTIASGGASHTCALEEGTAWCWGLNGAGQVGQPVAVEPPHVIDAPTSLGTLRDVDALGLGVFHSCAIVSGRVWCWGVNSAGQLGSMEPESSWTPLLVPPVE